MVRVHPLAIAVEEDTGKLRRFNAMKMLHCLTGRQCASRSMEGIQEEMVYTKELFP